MVKRSQINQIIDESLELCQRMNLHLPPFAAWSPEEWASKGHEYDEIRDNMLGWDVIDFKLGKFKEIGCTLFTIRNGNQQMDKYEKPYCEKLLIVGENQITPYHFHFAKMEDIINRGGGDLMVQVYNADENEQLADTLVEVNTDGHVYTVEAGTIIRLTPGESITLPPYQYHKFWAEGDTVLCGEVSMVNDDTADNRFLEELERYPTLEEDEPARYLLCNEYPPAPE